MVSYADAKLERSYIQGFTVTTRCLEKDLLLCT